MPEYRPGDVIEIETERGLVYVHVTHEHPSYPPVVRVIKGVHNARPADVPALVTADAHPSAMVPITGVLAKLALKHAKAGIAEIATNEQSFPTFRMPVRDKQGDIVYWWFWDGKGLTYATELTETQMAFPLRDVMSAAQFQALLKSEG